MTLSHRILETIASRFHVPPEALRMFRAASDLSGLDRSTLPTELIPLNSMQLARGLLNYAVFQSIPDWVVPFWVHRQFDPSDPAFIPRSHLGISLNVTHRNWTAVGNPRCPVEPVVDPRGMVTPFRNAWSIDVWLAVGGTIIFPSTASPVHQRLVDGVPIVETTLDAGGVRLMLTTWTEEATFIHRAAIANTTGRTLDCRLAFAIRPFNPEGVGLLHDLAWDQDEQSVIIEHNARVHFDHRPDRVGCGSFATGDASRSFGNPLREDLAATVHCPSGLANGFAEFRVALAPGERREILCRGMLQARRAERVPSGSGVEAAVRLWRTALDAGARLRTPDIRLNEICRASLATLLMLVDDTTITPGPLTYHQFWFRDAAAMVWALDKWGFHSVTRPIVQAYTARQERSGYFRSQQGEWDSNGQAAWSVWQHTVLSRSTETARTLVNALRRGCAWIDRQRHSGTPGERGAAEGLMPRGLSAEHLGLADHYFWDNFWSIAGLEAYVRLCTMLGRHGEAHRWRKAIDDYRTDVDRAILHAQTLHAGEAIPAGPDRRPDSGMIGSCSAWYPLQIFPGDDPRLRATLSRLLAESGREGMFFQHFIHSGVNPYLTLHIAHGWLLAGDRTSFWQLFERVLSRATDTGTFPEAIHPATGGGSMGDGHHGWAAAEVVLALRDAVVYERWSGLDEQHDLVFLGGIPNAWCAPGKSLSLEGVPVPDGVLTLRLNATEECVGLSLMLEEAGGASAGAWKVLFPFPGELAERNDPRVLRTEIVGGETHVSLVPGLPRHDLTVKRRG
jgi:hypothetical protein